MTVKRDERRPGRPWIIDISYVDRRTGLKKRYFRNAKLQTADGARREERMLLATYSEKGFIPERLDSPTGERGEPEITFKDAFNLYKKTFAHTLKPSTDHGYRKSVESHLLSRFGDLPLREIDRPAIIALDQVLAKDGLSASTRNNIMIPLRTIILNAIRLGEYTGKADFPTLNRVKSKVFEPPSPEQIAAVVAAAKPYVRTAIALAAYAGLRAAEVRGLRWEHVYLETETIVVRETITLGKIVAPKSGHERAIPMSPALLEILTEASKVPHKKDGPVAPSRKGTAWTESGLHGAFQRTLARAKVPHARLHDLRHFFITQCFVGGAGAPTVQKLAGHAELSTTQRYAHTTADLMREAVQVFTRKTA